MGSGEDYTRGVHQEAICCRESGRNHLHRIIVRDGIATHVPLLQQRLGMIKKPEAYLIYRNLILRRLKFSNILDRAVLEWCIRCLEYIIA